MTPARYRECLGILGQSQGDIADLLRCSDRLAHRWASGRITIPPGIAEWLEEWVAVRQAHPDPVPPDDWHMRRAERASCPDSLAMTVPTKGRVG
jgi:hypothetical protein